VTTPTRTRAQQGRSNNTKGDAWNVQVVETAREEGFPGACKMPHEGRGDVGGMLDWTIECKNMLEDRWPDVMRQVLADQAAEGTRWHAVAKKLYKQPARAGLWVMTIRQGFAIARILDDPRVQALIPSILGEGR
jgi:hypothetical protein